MTVAIDKDSLMTYLKDNKMEPEYQTESDQVFIVYQIHSYEVPVFFLIRKESSLLQMVAYLPFQVPETRFGEAARLLHILNRELDMPGFGMDESERLLFYRSTIPFFEGKVETRLFNMYLGTTRVVCDTFLHAIGMIVSGQASVDEVLKSK